MECRYSQVEKECLAFVWACERSSDFIWGRSITGETDHKPLVPMLTTHSLDQLPPRVQRFRMRLMRFNIKRMVHMPGKQMYTSDTLSRLQGKQPDCKPADSLIPDQEMSAFVCSIVDALPVSDIELKQIIEAQEEDEVCKQIRQYCLEGWPDKHRILISIKPYWSERGEITINQRVILKSMRILIPSAMRLEVLDKIHQGHQGITKCRERAKHAVWWPGLSRQIKDMVSSCRVCATHKINQPEPLCPTVFPEIPWQVMGTDLNYSQSVDYLLVADYFSRYVEVAVLRNDKTASEIIRALIAIFARNGIPEKVHSDNGPPYDSQEYSHFAREWGFQIAPSSPRYAQSNGDAERAVQTVKNILKKEKDKEFALLAYRSTPLSNGYSPVELVMGRRLHNTVPMFQSQLTPDWPDLE